MTSTVHVSRKDRQDNCAVCDKLLSPVDLAASKENMPLVCLSMICRRFVSDRKGLEPALYQFQLREHQNALCQSKEVEAEKRAYQEKIEKIELSESRLILKNVLKTHAKKLVQTPYVATVAFGRPVQSRLSEERIAAYRSHLHSIIESAFSAWPAEDDPDSEDAPDPLNDDAAPVIAEGFKSAELAGEVEKKPTLSKLPGQVCGVCQGDCCGLGGTEAFLRVATINRVRQSMPDLSAEDILDLYMSYMIEETAENACVNQSESGCVLPENLRSDTCNDYFCPELKSLIDQTEGDQDVAPVLIIKRAYHLWSRFDPESSNQVTDVVLINDDGVQSIDTEA